MSLTAPAKPNLLMSQALPGLLLAAALVKREVLLTCCIHLVQYRLPASRWLVSRLGCPCLLHHLLHGWYCQYDAGCCWLTPPRCCWCTPTAKHSTPIISTWTAEDARPAACSSLYATVYHVRRSWPPMHAMMKIGPSVWAAACQHSNNHQLLGRYLPHLVCKHTLVFCTSLLAWHFGACVAKVGLLYSAL